METLQNLCFSGFYRRIGKSSKDTKIWPRQLGRDRLLRSQQEVILGPKEECSGKRPVAKIEKKLQRKIMLRHRSVCRDTEIRQLLSRQENDVTIRNDCLMN